MRPFIFSLLLTLGLGTGLQAQPYIPTRPFIDLLDAIEKKEAEEEAQPQPAPGNNNGNNNNPVTPQLLCRIINTGWEVYGACNRIINIWDDEHEPVDNNEREENPVLSCYLLRHPLFNYILRKNSAGERGPNFGDGLFHNHINVETNLVGSRWLGTDFVINPAWNLTDEDMESDEVQRQLFAASDWCFNYHQ